MSGRWASSQRRSQLPRNWDALRRAVAARAHGQCEAHHNSNRCPQQGTECDHRDNPHDDHPGNLQWLCQRHHAEKTQAEAQTAAAAARAKLNRPTTPHPGLIPPHG